MRRLSVLFEGLPPDSAYQRDGLMWTDDNELTAAGIEIAQMWSLLLLSALTAKGTKLPPLVPITHPHRKVAEQKPKATPQEVAARFAQVREKGGETA